jgi:hypothetical protein
VAGPAGGRHRVLPGWWAGDRSLGPVSLADDAGLPDAGGTTGFRSIALAHNLRSREQVDTVLDQAERAGAEITRSAAETFYGGYAGYFADPDGHLWDVAYNPGFTLTDDGSHVLPDFGPSEPS